MPVARKTVSWLLLLLVASPAHADEQLARQHYDKGMVLYNLQLFARALDKFQAAYVEQPDPALLFNIGQAQRQLGLYALAAKSYRAYLAQTPNAPERDEVVARIGEMERAAQAKPAAPPIVAPSPLSPPAVHRRSWYRNPAGMTLAALGAAGAATGGVLLGLGSSYDSNAHHASTLPDQNRLHADAGTFTLAGGITLGAGGAALIVGAIVLAAQR